MSKSNLHIFAFICIIFFILSHVKLLWLLSGVCCVVLYCGVVLCCIEVSCVVTVVLC
jgi:hypothetical protein